MTKAVELPLWLFALIVLFAAVTFASHFLFPSVRWYFRRRLERAVAQLNQRLDRPIQPFKLTRRFDMIQRIIYNPQVSQAIADHARAEGIPENVAFQQARRYAREIVPSFSASLYFGVAIRAARFLSNALYHVRLRQLDEPALRAIDPEATVVFVMNHRSNMDYVLVTYLAADRSALAYAVGEWAQVWPLSRLIRAMGAYFIRRRSRNDLYRAVLACYVRLATGAGVTQAMFPEGGLSLTGGLMPAKLGLLKYITAGFDPEGRDVVFVPVALNYDRVLEDRILIAASMGTGRCFNARIGVIAGHVLRQLWLWLTGRYRRFGDAVVTFGPPLSLRALRAERSGDVTEVLADRLMRRIADGVPVLPVPLVAWLLQTHGAMTRAEIDARAAAALASLPASTVGRLCADPHAATGAGLRALSRQGALRQDQGRYVPDAQGGDLLRFYANSIRHLMPGDVPGNGLGAEPEAAPGDG
ncbi:1-acyl-sn-glycerol-3-phosphate acyltransferase [Antarcticimicrobium luteum]|uniref:Glycerol-3-phosphate acyltransferase n=1 Tax=Antarcticimicrobium luteum TaxID=2547397 RepID=A0A4R5UT02_9RHOB|nr:1-acyl-sn-glycerol-3-phosphate acyltransferase [Antarcticimicrobium luteum]TDK42274.1 glycerol-3-phosphate acyltransferase [Antarcticimicrobium luteum]